jgi:hypothetical protein
MPAFESNWYDDTNKKKLFWILQLCGWASLFLLAVNVLREDAKVLLPLIVSRSMLGLIVTSFVMRPFARWARRRSAAQIKWWLPALATLVVIISLGDAMLIRWLATSASREGKLTEAVLHFLNSSGPIRFVTYGSWLVFYFVLNNLIESNSARLRLERLKAGMIESELRLLRSQVNPHFLFNALNSIIAESGSAERVIRITQGLADYLRFSLSQNTELQPLGEELAALEGYLQVEKIRFEERLEYSLVADAEVRRRQVPGALVQPLLENAIKFGQLTSPRPLHISIHAEIRPEGLRIEVMNTGKWVPEGGRTSTGIGLFNLRRRLHLICGDGAHVSHEVLKDRVIFRVLVPSASNFSLVLPSYPVPA